MSALAAIHIKRRALGYDGDDEGWRGLVNRVTGQRSTRGLTPKQTRALLAECDRLLGGREGPAKARRKSSINGPYAAKLHALWIGCWNLGLVASRDDRALTAFVKRQTGIDNPTWMRDAADAKKVIEALKAIMARRGVRWSFDKAEPPYTKLPGYQIAKRQFILVRPSNDMFATWAAAQSGKAVWDMDYEDWVPIMNDLGRRVRAEVKAGRLDGAAG